VDVVLSTRYVPAEEPVGNPRDVVVPYLTLPRATTTGSPLPRTPRSIARDSEEHLIVGLRGRDTATVVQDGREAVLRPGDLAFYDSTRPYTLGSEDAFEILSLRAPHRALALGEAELRRITALAIPGDEGLGRLVSSFLSALAQPGPGEYSVETGAKVAGPVLDLLAALARERLGSEGGERGEDVARTTLTLRIRRFIDGNLAEPGLSPEMIAAAHHISVRYLHRLFQDEGTTVSRHIRQRRLQQCRRELEVGARTRPTVAAVAHRWGFATPAHFSRVFRAAYGFSPSECWPSPGSAGLASEVE
jgi:AraC-like DNA-binding protein